MKNTPLIALGLLLSATAFAGNSPMEPTEVPMATDLGLIGISLVLAGIAARGIARKIRQD